MILRELTEKALKNKIRFLKGEKTFFENQKNKKEVKKLIKQIKEYEEFKEKGVLT